MTHHANPAIECPFTVAVDGREKAPYTFTGLHADSPQKFVPLNISTEWTHLRTGDYSILGMEDLLCVERKTLSDLYSTLGSHRERFELEHQRMAAMELAVVVIEADWPTIVTAPPERSKLNPKSVFRTALAWYRRYGVPWFAMSSRRLAEVTTFRILERFWKDVNDERFDRRNGCEGRGGSRSQRAGSQSGGQRAGSGRARAAG